MTWLHDTAAGAILTVRVTTRARSTALAQAQPDALKIRLQAPPVDGKANQALRAFLAKTCDLPISRVELVGGEASRTKRILLRGLTTHQVKQRLGGAGA
ncbi:MAG: DUF167 domain-containing protein [Verrucomicrobia bacterium]|nr:DUF167 domain-containing protein [Verrucomicrobiota bacterium]